MRLGEMAFLPECSYITPRSVKLFTAPGYRIGKYIEPQDFTVVDLDEQLKYRVHQSASEGYERAELAEEQYRVKVYVYCSPCACQIATALDICRYRARSPFITFHIRIDYLLATSCCAPSSGIDGICSVIDRLVGVETNESEPLIRGMQAMDREWLEQTVDRAGELEEASESSPESEITRIVGYHSGEKKLAAIVILGETDYCVPLLSVRPFPSFEAGSRFRDNMMFMLKQTTESPGQWRRSYLATYSPKPPIIRTSSLPATVDKRQSDDTPEEKNKRPKTIRAGQ